jgi:hypothetical protein
VRRLLLVVFFLEIGLVLIVVPWLAFWDRNYFGQLVPLLGAFMTNNFVRGGVSGLGVINIIAGCVELGSILLARSASRHASILSS